MSDVLAYILKVLQAAPALIAAGQDAYSLVAGANAAVAQMTTESRGPTDAEWSALHAEIDALMTALGD